jgi:hypothetical protein
MTTIFEATDLMTLRAAAGLFPAAARPSVRTLQHWSRRGVDGHRLRTVRVGGMTRVRRADLEDFLRRLNGGGEG